MIPSNTVNWQANWIWYKGAGETPDFYFYARKSFATEDSIKAAKLHISAYTDYILYINGKYMGRGPGPSLPKHQYYDTYDIQDLLMNGKNVIGILAHNFAIGMHWQAMGPSGLIVQVELSSVKGMEYIVTDESWKVKRAECYLTDSPRMMWPSQFVETFDARLKDKDWIESGFDDTAWSSPQILGIPPVYPWEYLIPREIPQLKEEVEKIVSVKRGDFNICGYHTVGFRGIGLHQNCLVYAQAYFYSEMERELLLSISCDDAFKAFLNGRLVVEQLYNDSFVRSTMWNLREDYEQFHYGQGIRKEDAPVILIRGWNRLLIIVDKAPDGWGFGMGFVDHLNTNLERNEWSFNPRKYEEMLFSDRENGTQKVWILSGPYESTGLKNSLDGIDESRMPEGNTVLTCNSKDYSVITDYSCLMRAEVRTNFRIVEDIESIALKEGEFLIAAFDAVKAGIPILSLQTEDDSIIDIGYGNVLPVDKKISFMWNMRYTDRIYTGKGVLNWQSHWVRECRYFFVSCRKGINVILKDLSINSIGYPVEQKSWFQCSNSVLNQIHKTSVYTTKLLMQHDYMDCMKREGATHNQRSFIHASIGALHVFGDHLLIRKNILNAIRTQEESGWFNSHGASDNNADEPTQMFWWVELLQKYDLYTGDTTLVISLYQRLKGLLRYFSRLENSKMLIDSRNENREVRNRICYVDDQSDYGGAFTGLFDGMLFTFNILYYGALHSAAYLAEKTGHTTDAAMYRKKAFFLKKSINEVFWDPRTDMYVSWVKELKNSGACGIANLIAALYYGVCDEEKEKKVLQYLCKTLGGEDGNYEKYELSFGFFFFFLEVLFRHGKVEMAYGLCHAFFGRWQELGITTFTENLRLKDFVGASQINVEYNTHGYGTAVLVYFYSHILGIRPLNSGFTRISIEPFAGELLWAEGKMFTPMGMIEVHWKIEGEFFYYNVLIPEGCSYEIKMPEKFHEYRFTVNGKLCHT